VGFYGNNMLQTFIYYSPSSEVNVTGLFIGCYAIEGLLKSILEYFFDSTCFRMILNHLSLSNSNDFNSLDIDRTQYAALTTIEMLSDNAFLENWTAQISFENYFTECASRLCLYTYQQHDNLLYVLTTLLGLYGGLTTVLRFFLPVLIDWWRRRSIRTTNRAVCK
jgi:hypothetical protein